VDLLHVGSDAPVDVVVQRVQLIVVAPQAGGNALGLAKQCLACRRRRRVVREVRPGAVEVLQGGGESARRRADQVVDLAGVGLQGIQLPQCTLRRVQLVGCGLAEAAADTGDGDAAAHGYTAVRLRL